MIAVRTAYLVLCCGVALAPIPGISLFLATTMAWSVLGRKYVPLVFIFGLAPMWVTGLSFGANLISSALDLLHNAQAEYKAMMQTAIQASQTVCQVQNCSRAGMVEAHARAYNTMLGTLRPFIYGAFLSVDLPVGLLVGVIMWEAFRAVKQIRQRLRNIHAYVPFARPKR